MSNQKSALINRHSVERLLGGVGAGSHDFVGHEAFDRVLAAATAPARPEELTGEPATLAAFRAAHLVPAPRPWRPSMMKSAALKVFTLKAAIVLAGAAATGGIALAASNGAVPSPFTPKAPSISTDPSESGQLKGGSKGGTPSAKPSPDKSRDAGDKGSPSPSLVGLCRAYFAGNKAERGKALENPAFSALIDAAGGTDNVETFCDTFLASAKPQASKTDGNTDDAKGGPKGPPTAKPTDRGGR